MKSCRKPGTSFSLPCQCQWLCVMKAFRLKHEEKCNTRDAPLLLKKYEEFCTGSTYEGEWRKGCGMHGYGVYTFPNGVVYKGEFRDGEMHGTGELRYKTRNGIAAIRGLWKNGTMIDRTFIFDDILDYDEHDWKYCKMPDRRFSVEYVEGLQPAGRSYQTPHQPTLKVPAGYCDTEDGFYDLKRKVIVRHQDPTRLVRGPSSRERRWIVDNCRVESETLNVGPRPDFYEEFVEPAPCPPPEPGPSAKTRFELKSEFSEIFVSELYKTIENIKETTLTAVPTELLLT